MGSLDIDPLPNATQGKQLAVLVLVPAPLKTVCRRLEKYAFAICANHLEQRRKLLLRQDFQLGKQQSLLIGWQDTHETLLSRNHGKGPNRRRTPLGSNFPDAEVKKRQSTSEQRSCNGENPSRYAVRTVDFQGHLRVRCRSVADGRW